MERKLHDLFMDTVGSPNATYLDFVNVGYTPENTSLLDISTYRNNDWVRDHFKDQYGNFDEGAFQETYDMVLSNYNNLAVEDREKFLRSQISYHRDNIFAPRELRRQGPDYYEIKMVNPLRQVYGLTTLGRVEDPTMSIDEIALSNKVLANPTTAGADLSNAIWEDTPNGHFGKYFWDTLVLAQYDEDGEHIDPITGEKIKHSKGEFKLNEDGEFYYEKLDGRSIYGRLVLNKANILTVDGSKMNKYDFFDSDDLELKSIAGSLFKNAALVGSMFIPYVGPVVLTATLATEIAGIGAVFGKMLAGSDSPTLSAIEGWSASMDRRRARTQYAQEHPWCWESFITMIGDFTLIGATLRFLFTKMPRLIMGKDVMSEAGLTAELLKLVESELTLRGAKIKDLLKDSVVQKNKKNYQILRRNIEELRDEELISAMALAKLLPLIKEAQTLGHTLSKGYMALSIANDTYGEAKAEGASDLDATLLTLGYTAGLYGFLNAGVSQWIFPELRVEGYRAKAIAKALISKDKETENLIKKFGTAVKSFDKKAKKDYVKKVFNIGKKIANAEYANGTKTLSATAAAAVGMGVEGVGFEFLSDLSRGCYDVVKWLQGSNHRLDTFGYNHETNEWNPTEMLSSYGMNFLSAVVGGSITGFFGTYNQLRALNNVTNQRAIQELIFMSRNGQLNDFLKRVDNMELGNKYLSATEFNLRTHTFAPGTETNNQDYFNKQAIRMQAHLIDDILNAHGANISDESFLDVQTLKELRFAVLLKSSMAGLYLNEYNSKLAELVEVTSRLNEKNLSKLDLNNDGSVTDTEGRLKTNLTTTEAKEIDELLRRLAELSTEIEELVTGKRSYEFVCRSLYEMTGIISGENSVTSLELWCYANYGKRYEDLSNTDKNDALGAYKTWLDTEGREMTRDAADIFHLLQIISNETIAKLSDEYHNSRARLKELSDLNKSILKLLLPEAQDEAFDFTLDDVLKSQISAEEWLGRAQYSQSLLDALDGLDLMNLRLIETLGNELERARLTELFDAYRKTINDIIEARDLKKSEEELNNLENAQINAGIAIRDYGRKVISENIDNYIKDIENLGYVSTEVRNLLNNTLDLLKERVFLAAINDNTALSEIIQEKIDKLDNELLEKGAKYSAEEQEALEQLIASSRNLISTFIADNAKNIASIAHMNDLAARLAKLPESPLVRNLEEFLKLVSNNDRLSVLGVLDEVNTIYNRTTNNITNFKLEGDLLQRLAEVLSIMRLYRASIVAARTDNAGLNNYYGYNATLNEVAEKNGMSERLVELDALTADVFVEDLTNNINKLEYLNKLNLLNQGLKLSAQSRIDTRKNILIYKRINQVFNITDLNDPLSKWEGITDLQNVINGMTTHQDLIKNNIFTTNKENEVAFEREKISLEDAINDFFKKNADKDLHELINGNRFSLLEPIEDTLNETVERFSDNSIIWWLCSRAALRASDFYSQYLEIIGSDIIPLATQEMGIYLNYASIVNGNMYTKFKDVYDDAVTTQWKGLSIEDRKEALKRIAKINIDPSLLDLYSSDSMADYCSNFLPLPKNANFVLNEGIAGAGKSLGLLPLTISLLKKFHPEVLLNVILIHGGNKTRALELSDSLGLKGTKGLRILGPQEWRDYVGISKDVPAIDTKTKTIDVPESIIGFTDKHNVLASRLTVKEFRQSERPNLIIVDEVQRLSWFDIEALQQVAEKLGITVLSSGDFDLTGINADTEVKINASNQEFSLNGLRTDFARIPTMGVSMRTDNVIKTRNLLVMLSYIHTPKESRQTTHLEYMINDEGLFGDRIIVTDDAGTAAIDSDFIASIDTMVRTRKEGEKIGYISNAKDYESPILKYIQDNYADAFELKTMDAATGDEATYYIIDVDSDSDVNDIYTGMTRALKGSLILMRANATYLSDRKVNFNIDEPLSEASKQLYAKKRIELLSLIVKPGAKIDIIPRGTSEQVLSSAKLGPDDMIDPSKMKKPTPPPDESTPSNEPTATVLGEEGNLFDFGEAPREEVPKEETPKSALNAELSLDFPEEYQDLSFNEKTDPSVIETVSQGYEDSFANIDGGIKSEELAQRESDDRNMNDKHEPSNPFYVEEINLVFSIREILSTFNVFGLGMEVEGDHFVVREPEGEKSVQAFKKRIDGANGLIKLLFGPFKGTTIDELNEYLSDISVKTVEDLLAFILSILYNRVTKSDIATSIAECLTRINPNLNLGSGICVDFAFKQSPHASEGNDERWSKFVEREVTAFALGIDELSRYSWTIEDGSFAFPEKKFVALIARKGPNGREYVLEIPLMTMNSPLTLMLAQSDGKELFGEVHTYFREVLTRLINENADTSENVLLPQVIREVIKKFDTPEYAKYRNLINRFKIFDFSYRDITFIATDSNGKLISIGSYDSTNPKKSYGEVERMLDNSEWTPFKCLELLGARLVKQRGLYQVMDEYHYLAGEVADRDEWTTLAELSKSPRCRITSVYINTQDSIPINGKLIEFAKKGHSFVLISHDLELDNNKAIIDYYIRLLSDPSILRKVELVYVLPPHATVLEYVDNLKFIFTTKIDEYTKKQIKPIGLLFTSFRIWEKLLFGTDTELRLRTIKRLLDKGYDEEGIIQEISDKILLLKGMTIEQVWDELTDTGFVSELRNKHAEERRHYRLPNANTKLSSYFDFLLLELTLNVDNGKLYQSNEGVRILEDAIPGIYYNTKGLEDSNDHMGLTEVARAKDEYTIDGRPFRINGKIDTYMFRGNLDPVYQFFLDNSETFRTERGALVRSSLDQSFYLDHTSGNKALVKTVTPETVSETGEVTHLKFNNTNAIPIDRLLKELNIDELKGPIRIYRDFDCTLEIKDIKEIRKRGGSYSFTLKINNEKYNASFNNKRNDRTLEIKDEKCTISLTITL